MNSGHSSMSTFDKNLEGPYWSYLPKTWSNMIILVTILAPEDFLPKSLGITNWKDCTWREYLLSTIHRSKNGAQTGRWIGILRRKDKIKKEGVKKITKFYFPSNVCYKCLSKILSVSSGVILLFNFHAKMSAHL